MKIKMISRNRYNNSSFYSALYSSFFFSTSEVQMWQHKSGISMRLPMKGLSITRSAICLQSSVATEPILRSQAVRHAISGNDIINLQNSDAGNPFIVSSHFVYRNILSIYTLL